MTQIEMSYGPAKASVKVGGPFSDGFHVGASLAIWDRANIAPFHTTRTNLVAFSPTELLGCLAETSAEAESLFSGGLCIDEPLSTLGKVETEGDRALKGLKLSNYVLSPPRVGIEEGGVLGRDEGDRVEGASDLQGIDTSFNQSVLALTKAEIAYAVEALGDVESSSPLVSINPLRMVVTADLNCNTEVRRLDNTLKVSNWMKYRLPGFSKMMRLSLGRHEKRCIMLLQRLEMEIEVAKRVHRKDAAHQKVVSKDKGKRELRNLISSINYDGR